MHICGFTYGDEEQGVSFDSLPENWIRPICTASKRLYRELEENEEKSSAAAPGTPTSAI